MIELIPKNILEGHEHPIYALSTSQKEHILFSAGGEAAVVEWSLKKMAPIKVLFKSSGSIYVLYSPTNYPYLISADRNGMLSIFDFEKQTLVFQKRVCEASIFGLLNIGNVLYFISDQGILYFFDLDKHEIVHQLSLSTEALRSISYDQEKNILYTAGKDRRIFSIHLDTLELNSFDSTHTLPIFSLAYDSLNNQLLSGSRDAQLKVWKDGLHENIPAHMFAINDIELMKDAPYFATASMDKSIKIWDKKELNLLAVSDPIKNTGHTKSVNRLAFTSFENLLIS